MVREQRQPFPPVYAAAFSAACVFYFSLPAGFIPAVFFLICAVCCAVSALVHLKIRSSSFIGFALLAGCAIGFFTAFRLPAEKVPLYTLSAAEQISGIEGTLCLDPQSYGSRYHLLTLESSSVWNADGSRFSARGKCRVLLPRDLIMAGFPGGSRARQGGADRLFLSAGMTVSIPAKLIKSDASQGQLLNGSDVHLLEKPGWPSALRSVLRYRLFALLYNRGPAGAMLSALITGSRDYIDAEVIQDYRDAGLSHLLALSGMHLALVALAGKYIGRIIGGKRLAVPLALLIMFMFVWFAGYSPSLVRAALMALIMTASEAVGFRKAALPALAATFLAQLLIAPADSVSLSFILSYTALAGILTLGENLSDLSTGRLPALLGQPLAAALAAQLFTAPVTIVMLGSFAPAGIAASCLVTPLLLFFLSAGLVVIPVCLLLPVCTEAGMALIQLLYQGLAFTVGLFSGISPLHSRSAQDTILMLLIPVLALPAAAFFCAMDRKRRSVDGCFARL